MLTPQSIETDALSVEYVEVGSGPTDVVLLHGNYATWRWWAPVLARLPKGVRAFAPTMRGCVGTRGDDGDFGIGRLSADLGAFVRAVGLRRFHLVGHSLGGAIAIQYALDEPTRLTGLDLVSPAPGDALESMMARDTASGRMLRAMNPDRLLDRTALLALLQLGQDLGTSRLYLRRTLLEQMPGADQEAVDFERLLSDAVGMHPDAVVGVYRALFGWDVRGRRNRIRVPTRVMAGANDSLVPLEALEALTRAIPGATLVVRPGGGHSPMLEDPAAFGRWLAAGLPAPQRERRPQGWFAAWLARPATRTFAEAAFSRRGPVLLDAAPRTGTPPEPLAPEVLAPEALAPEARGPGRWTRMRFALRRFWSWFRGRPPPPRLGQTPAAQLQ